VEGIVIVAPRTAVLSHLASLPLHVPIVAAQGEQRDAGGIPVISVDQQAGVRMIMRYLIEQGHERILHLAGPPDWNDAQSRLRAQAAELRSAGLPVLPAVFGDWTADSGYSIGRDLVDDVARARFTAVFSSNDQMALGLIHAFREAGLDVPRDMSVSGFDDIPESAHFWPPLTTVRQDFAQLGKRCVNMLVDAIHGAGADPAPATTTPRLIIRASVVPPVRLRGSAPDHPRRPRSRSPELVLASSRLAGGDIRCELRGALEKSRVPGQSSGAFASLGDNSPWHPFSFP
jgi:DNA-binding LacI/PurR family transcriptional regulator